MNLEIIRSRISLRNLDPTKDYLLNYLGWLRDTENNQFIKSADKEFELANLQNYITQKNNSNSALLLGIFLMKETKLIGTIKLEPIDYSSQIAWLGMMIGDLPSRGEGYGFEALAAVLDYAFNNMDLMKIFLGVDKKNFPAIRLYNKTGFSVIEENESNYTMALDLKKFNFDKIIEP